jgi:hypothetical protein
MLAEYSASDDSAPSQKADVTIQVGVLITGLNCFSQIGNVRSLTHGKAERGGRGSSIVGIPEPTWTAVSAS